MANIFDYFHENKGVNRCDGLQIAKIVKLSVYMTFEAHVHILYSHVLTIGILNNSSRLKDEYEYPPLIIPTVDEDELKKESEK